MLARHLFADAGSLVSRVNRTALSALEPRGQTCCRMHQKIGTHCLEAALAIVKTAEAAQTRDHGALRELFETDNTWNE
jgi:hypothetical protein